MRTGLIAQKMGMTRVFTGEGEHVPVTVLKVDNLQVVDVLTKEKNGYSAVQLGWGTAKVKNVAKPQRGHFARAKVEPKRKLVEFRVSDDAVLDVGAEVLADHFVAGQLVDVVGTSIGKGFAGTCVEGQEDGRPHGRCADDHSESGGCVVRRGSRPDHGPGRRTGLQGRVCPCLRCGKAGASEGCTVPCEHQGQRRRGGRYCGTGCNGRVGAGCRGGRPC